MVQSRLPGSLRLATYLLPSGRTADVGPGRAPLRSALLRTSRKFNTPFRCLHVQRTTYVPEQSLDRTACHTTLGVCIHIRQAGAASSFALALPPPCCIPYLQSSLYLSTCPNERSKWYCRKTRCFLIHNSCVSWEIFLGSPDRAPDAVISVSVLWPV